MQSVNREDTYRFFVTTQLQLIPQNKWLVKGLDEILGDTVIEPREAEDIISEITEKAGLIIE